MTKLDNTLQSRGANRLRGCLHQIDATDTDCQNEQFLGPPIHSCLLANRFNTDQFLVKTALFGSFDQNVSKHMPDPSADTLAENDQSLLQTTDKQTSLQKTQPTEIALRAINRAEIE